MQEDIVITINVVLYSILVCYCFKTFGWRNLSSIISVVYLLNAICGTIMYFSPFYYRTISSSGEVTIAPCLFLFSMNSLLILAFKRCVLSEHFVLTNYDGRIVRLVELCLVFVLGLYLLYELPYSVQSFFDAPDLGDMRQELYSGSLHVRPLIIEKINSWFTELSLLLLAIVSINYFLLKKNDLWDKAALMVYLLMKINFILGVVSRATVVFSIIEVFMILIIFSNFISKRIFKRIGIVVLFVFPLIYLFMSSVSSSRFGDDDSALEVFTTFRYAGESQINFMALEWPDLKEPFMGYMQFPLFRRFMGLDYNDNQGRESGSVYDTNIERKYHYNNPVYIFHTLVGSIYFEVGIIGTISFVLLFYIMMQKRYKKNNHRLSFMTIVMLIYFAPMIFKGIFFFEYGSERGNFMMFWLLLLSLSLHNRKNIEVVKEKSI